MCGHFINNYQYFHLDYLWQKNNKLHSYYNTSNMNEIRIAWLHGCGKKEITKILWIRKCQNNTKISIKTRDNKRLECQNTQTYKATAKATKQPNIFSAIYGSSSKPLSQIQHIVTTEKDTETKYQPNQPTEKKNNNIK